VAGFFQTCAQLATGELRCWGENGDGQLGYRSVETIGDDESPATAGNVPLTGVDDAGWTFTNSQGLDVWLREELADSHGTSMRFYPRASNGLPLRGLTAFMFFGLEDNGVNSVTIDPRRGNESAVSLEQEPDERLLLVKFVFPSNGTGSSSPESRRLYFGEGFRLSYTNGDSIWFAGDDYSASEQVRRSWYRSQRVQIVDEAGRIVYGWTRSSSVR
jgi:hypothetical protein